MEGSTAAVAFGGNREGRGGGTRVVVCCYGGWEKWRIRGRRMACVYGGGVGEHVVIAAMHFYMGDVCVWGGGGHMPVLALA